MITVNRAIHGLRVALRKESVDRNTLSIIILGLRQVVALRKESVDRNIGSHNS